jgi:integrase
MKRQMRMVTLAQAYLAEKRCLGFDLRSAGRQLLNFARFADAAGHQGPLTAELAMSWAQSAPHHAPITWARRIEIVRPFAKYLQQFDITTEIPGSHLFGRAHRRLAPHIYTAPEIQDLLAAAAKLPAIDALRPARYVTLFGLLASTGLRVSEALKMRRADVDLEQGQLTIRETKFRKSRLVPLHLSVTQALRNYASLRDRWQPVALSDHFFLSSHGDGLPLGTVEYVFGSLRSKLEWASRGDHPTPRIHDLRHSFICHRVLLWYRQGVNVDNAMAMLSTYVGHAKVTDTYWYLTGIPELMTIAAQRFERFAQGANHG